MEYEGHWHPRTMKGSSFPAAALTNPKANLTKTNHDMNGANIDRKPPKLGEPTERKRENTTEY